MLEHLRISHAESYRNMNQSATFWNSFAVADEEKILADFENAKGKFMIAAFFADRIVGGLGFMGQMAEFTKQNGTIGMSIQNEFSNSGLGTEMMKYMLALAKQFGFHRVDLSVRTYNTGGIALYEKMGFERIGLLKEASFIDGEYVNEYSYQKII